MAKTRNMSIALESALQDRLKDIAQKKNISVSSLIRETLEKFLLSDGNMVKLVMQIPKEITNDRNNLESWLNLKVQALLNHFSS